MFTMTSLRIAVMAAALVLLAVAPGGCPLADRPAGDAASEADPAPADLAAGGNGSGSSDEKASILEELATDIAAGEQGQELARSYGSTSISTSPDYVPEGAYPPGYNPYWDRWDDGDTGDGPGGAGDGGGSGYGGGDGSGGGTSGSSDDDRCGDGYAGTLDCLRTESLGDMGGPSEEYTVYLTVGLDEDGIPSAMPVPAFIAEKDDTVVLVRGRHVGDNERHRVPFNDIEFEMTVTVADAEYTPESVAVVLDLDVAWFGERSSITASGTHTVRMQVVDGRLEYSSQTHYDAEFQADDWMSPATRHYDCRGTLSSR
jgi:hypothetical protein